MVLLARTNSILSLTSSLAILHILNPSFDAIFIVCCGQDANSGSHNSAATRGIAYIIYIGLRSSSSNSNDRLNLTSIGHPQSSKLRSNSSAVWFPVSGWESMNVMSKDRLQLFFSDNGPRVRNEQRKFLGLGLVGRRRKESSNKACLNVLSAEDSRWVGARLSIKLGDEVGIRGDDKASTRGDDKVGIGGDDEVGIGGRDKASIREDNEASIRRQDIKAEMERWDIKRVVEPAARACHTGAQRLLRYAFLFAVHSNFFLAFLSSESVISWSSFVDSIANFGLSVTSTNRDAPFSR